jgi:hypothetical protein
MIDLWLAFCATFCTDMMLRTSFKYRVVMIEFVTCMITKLKPAILTLSYVLAWVFRIDIYKFMVLLRSSQDSKASLTIRAGPTPGTFILSYIVPCVGFMTHDFTNDVFHWQIESLLTSSS